MASAASMRGCRLSRSRDGCEATGTIRPGWRGSIRRRICAASRKRRCTPASLWSRVRMFRWDAVRILLLNCWGAVGQRCGTGAVSQREGYLRRTFHAPEFYSDSQHLCGAEMPRDQHYSRGSQWVRCAGTRSGTGVGAAQALSRAISHGADERVAGEPVGVRRDFEGRRSETDCGRLARAVGKIYAGAREILDLQVSYLGWPD